MSSAPERGLNTPEATAVVVWKCSQHCVQDATCSSGKPGVLLVSLCRELLHPVNRYFIQIGFSLFVLFCLR